jgi:hypothetical protein
MFCRIYLTGRDITTDRLLTDLSNLLKKPVVGNMYIEDSVYSISVRNNDEYDKVKEKEFPGGFLNFKLFIEFDFEDAPGKNHISDIVAKVLQFLWANNYPAIASCNFEELLPEKGGYKSTNIPWMK